MTDTKKLRGRPRKDAAQEIPPGSLAHYQAPPAPVSETDALISAITRASRDPKVDIDKMDWLLKTAQALKKEEARVSYNEAMARVQAALEPVRKDALNPQTSSKYATEAGLDAAIRPYYVAEGFSLSFDTEEMERENFIRVVCYVLRGGEQRRHTIPMPCDGLGPKGTPVMSRTHATGSAFSYGRRYLRGAVFNVLTQDMAAHDDDGNAAGRRYEQRRSTPAHDPRTGEVEEPAQASKTDIAVLRAIMKRADVEESLVCDTFGVDKLEDLTSEETKVAVKKCNKKLNMMTETMHEDLNKVAPNG